MCVAGEEMQSCPAVPLVPREEWPRGALYIPSAGYRILKMRRALEATDKASDHALMQPGAILAALTPARGITTRLVQHCG
jgi:hypothetical protein